MQDGANKLSAVSLKRAPGIPSSHAIVQLRFVGDPINHVYVDQDTGDWYDILGRWGDRYLLQRRRDGHQVWMDTNTNEPVDESEEDRLRRLNQTSLLGMRHFGASMLSSGKRNESEAYATYSQYEPPEGLPGSEYDEYLDELSRIDLASRSQQVESHPQREDPYSDRYTTRHTLTSNPANTRTKDLDLDFYRAESTQDVAQDPTLSRLTLRLDPRGATQVWEFVSTQLVGHRGVKSAKVAGPRAINERTDSIIIYLNSNHPGLAEEIASILTSRFGPAYFVPGVPFGMLELSPGIGWAERHPEYSSHGTARAVIMELALQMLDAHRRRLESVGLSLSQEEAQALLNRSFLPEAMRQFGVDPSAPHQNMSSDEYTFGRHQFKEEK